MTLNITRFSIITFSIMTLRKRTLSITTFSIMTLRKRTFSIMTLSIMTFSIMKLSISTFNIRLWWKLLTEAHYVTELITAVKSFKIQPRGLAR